MKCMNVLDDNYCNNLILIQNEKENLQTILVCLFSPHASPFSISV